MAAGDADGTLCKHSVFVLSHSYSLYNLDVFSPQTNSVFGLLIGHEFDTVFSSSLFLGVVDLKAEGGAWVEAVCVVGEV